MERILNRLFLMNRFHSIHQFLIVFHQDSSHVAHLCPSLGVIPSPYHPLLSKKISYKCLTIITFNLKGHRMRNHKTLMFVSFSKNWRNQENTPTSLCRPFTHYGLLLQLARHSLKLSFLYLFSMHVLSKMKLIPVFLSRINKQTELINFKDLTSKWWDISSFYWQKMVIFTRTISVSCFCFGYCARGMGHFWLCPCHTAAI